jgi:hypothetical protein
MMYGVREPFSVNVRIITGIKTLIAYQWVYTTPHVYILSR